MCACASYVVSVPCLLWQSDLMIDYLKTFVLSHAVYVLCDHQLMLCNSLYPSMGRSLWYSVVQCVGVGVEVCVRGVVCVHVWG